MSAPLTPEERMRVNSIALGALAKPEATARKDNRSVAVLQHMVGDVDLRTAAQLALKWLEVNSPPWSATFEIATLRAALKAAK